MTKIAVVDDVVLNDWYAVARSENVEEGSLLQARLLDQDLVLWRCNGQALAWQDLCVYRGARLSMGWVESDTVVCPYHGWTYDAKGQCVKIPAHPKMLIPARACVKSYQVQERYGLVWVSLGNPHRDVPSFPMWADPTYIKVLCGPFYYQTSGGRAIENFIDVSHFPFAHKDLFGDPTKPEVNNYKVEVGPDGITASGIQVWQPNPDGTGGGGMTSYTYQIIRPLTAYLVKEWSGYRAVFLTITPVEELKSIGWFAIATNCTKDISEEQIRAFTELVTTAQDIPIVDSQRPQRLPLDLDAELLVGADRDIIAYRKWLREMGFSFGTTGASFAT